jgi:hypothetical protein
MVSQLQLIELEMFNDTLYAHHTLINDLYMISNFTAVLQQSDMIAVVMAVYYSSSIFTDHKAIIFQVGCFTVHHDRHCTLLYDMMTDI